MLITTLNIEVDRKKMYREKLVLMNKDDYWKLQIKEKLGYISKNEKVFKIK